MSHSTEVTQPASTPSAGPSVPDDPKAAPRRRRHPVRWVLWQSPCWFWPEPACSCSAGSTAGRRRCPPAWPSSASGTRPASDRSGAGPAPGVYSYRGSGTETISVPPSRSPRVPVSPAPWSGWAGGCYEFRLDYSDRHWQSWDYCVRSGALDSPSRAGYYDWIFVAFDVHDTSTFRCSPAFVTIPADIVQGAREVVACTGSNDNLAIGPVFMRGTSKVVGPTSVRVAGQAVPTVQVDEQVTFSGGQSGFNPATTWFSAATGLPLRGAWHTVVSTASPVGHSTLDAHGDFTLTSLTPQRSVRAGLVIHLITADRAWLRSPPGSCAARPGPGSTSCSPPCRAVWGRDMSGGGSRSRPRRSGTNTGRERTPLACDRSPHLGGPQPQPTGTASLLSLSSSSVTIRSCSSRSRRWPPAGSSDPA